MANRHPRMAREHKTVEAMLDIYCRGHHGRRHHGRSQHELASGLCEDCEVLRDYAHQRLQSCPYREGKTTCAKCPIHCYRPQMRSRIRAVMRYAGPRMLYRDPLMALHHLIDGFRKEPIVSREGGIRRARGAKKARTQRCATSPE